MTTTEEIIRAASDPADGVLYEPRGFVDSFQFTQGESGLVIGNVQRSHPDTFVNGEQFPIVITHISFGMRYRKYITAFSEQIWTQCFGVRVKIEDQFYPCRAFTPTSLWINKHTATAGQLGHGGTCWRFDKPFVFKPKTGLRVSVRQETTGPGNTINVVAHGIGMLSRRPYVFDTRLVLSTSTALTAMPTADIFNDGTEPVAITEMMFDAVGTLPQTWTAENGNIAAYQFNVRGVGSGTGADWFNISPHIPGDTNLATPLRDVFGIPGHLLGLSHGFSPVHKIPGGGWVWYPGQQADVEVEALGVGAPAFAAARSNEGAPNIDDTFVMGMFGYVVVK